MKPGLEGAYIGRMIHDIRNPRRFEDGLFRQIGKSLDPVERKITQSILGNFKCRAAAIGFFADPLDLPPEQRLGAIFFVGLVFAADDAMDKPGYFRRSADPNVLRDALLTQTASISGKPIVSQTEEITMGGLMGRALSKFPEEKQQLIHQFLDDMLRNETEIKNRTPGIYSYESAQTYRKKTSDSFVRIGMKLMGVDDEEKIEKSVIYGHVLQMIDDAADVAYDCEDNTINPLIALAYENCEGEMLRYMAEVACLERSMGLLDSVKIVQDSQRILKQLPKTRNAYRESFHEQLNQLPKGPTRLFLETVGKAVL